MELTRLLNNDEVVIINPKAIKHDSLVDLTFNNSQIIIIRADLKSVFNMDLVPHLSNVIIATTDKDYADNLYLVKEFELKKIGVLSLKAFPGNVASLESIFKTVSSLKFNKIACILEQRDVVDFLSICSPHKYLVLENNAITEKEFAGTANYFQNLEISLIEIRVKNENEV